MKRLIYNELKNWKEKTNRKPLILHNNDKKIEVEMREAFIELKDYKDGEKKISAGRRLP